MTDHIPSMYQQKGLRKDPDLILAFQLVSIALAHLMEDRGIASFIVPTERVSDLRMAKVETETDESDRILVRLES